MQRRRFISQLALAATPALAASSAEAEHTLVHVFLRGGADTLNMIVPVADDRYHRLRPSLAIAANQAIDLGGHYALHPRLQPLEAAFKEGRFGAVQAVGVDNDSGSHFECQDQMEHGDSAQTRPAGGGWLGRFLRLHPAHAGSALSAVAIGSTLPESLRGAPAASVLQQLSDISLKGDGTQAVVSALQRLYGSEVSLLGQSGQQTLDLFKRVSELQQASQPPQHGALYPKDPFAEGLREIARLIKARLGLRVACLDLGGWDTHFFQGSSTGSQAQRIGLLAESLAAFERDLSDQRRLYTVMITTEFGRRIYENASLGTDHGRGFALMALGHRVKGGRILGQWPIQSEEDLNLNTPGPGGLHAQTDYRSVFAEVLRACFGQSLNSAAIFPDAKLDLRPTGLMSFS